VLRRIGQEPALSHAERVETSLTIHNREALPETVRDLTRVLPKRSPVFPNGQCSPSGGVPARRILHSGRNDKLHIALRILGIVCVARHKALPICHVDRSGDISHYLI